MWKPPQGFQQVQQLSLVPELIRVLAVAEACWEVETQAEVGFRVVVVPNRTHILVGSRLHTRLTLHRTSQNSSNRHLLGLGNRSAGEAQASVPRSDAGLIMHNIVECIICMSD